MKYPILIFCLFTGLPGFAQNGSGPFLTQGEMNSVFSNIQALYSSDSSIFFTDSRRIPDSILLFIIKTTDSLEGRPGKWKKQKADKRITKFIANQGEDYEATDVITSDGPRRRFVCGIIDSTGLLFYYFHGGRGKHLHVVYVDMKANLYSSFVTWHNYDAIRDIDYEAMQSKGEKKVKKWRTVLKAPLVSERDIKAINNSLYEDYDIF
jgi:hypothetical protein